MVSRNGGQVMECKVNIPELGDRFTQLECMYMKGEPCSRLFGRRGYYLAVRDVRIQRLTLGNVEYDRVSLGEGDESKVYFLEGCERKSPKRFREFVESMNRNAERIAKAFRAQKFDAVWDYV